MKYLKARLIKEIKENDVIKINEKDLIKPKFGERDFNMKYRGDGEFEDKGVYLSKLHNWQIIEDSNNCLVLVATIKYIK